MPEIMAEISYLVQVTDIWTSVISVLGDFCRSYMYTISSEVERRWGYVCVGGGRLSKRMYGNQECGREDRQTDSQTDRLTKGRMERQTDRRGQINASDVCTCITPYTYLYI